MEKAVIRDRETGEELTLAALRKEYENLKRAGETEAGCFEDYLENITDGNGTCDWIQPQGRTTWKTRFAKSAAGRPRTTF